MRYLALGDSYTIGEGVDPAARWPNQLAALLRGAGHELPDPTIIARTGWTTAELDAAITSADPPGTFDLVSLLIGVNNQYRGLSLDDYRREFTALLDHAIGFAGGAPSHVLALSIPDWGVTPFAEGRDRPRIAAEIDAFNGAARDVTLDRAAHWVDITPVSRSSAHRASLADDSLHPSAAQYRAWAELALPAALDALRA